MYYKEKGKIKQENAAILKEKYENLELETKYVNNVLQLIDEYYFRGNFYPRYKAHFENEFIPPVGEDEGFCTNEDYAEVFGIVKYEGKKFKVLTFNKKWTPQLLEEQEEI